MLKEIVHIGNFYFPRKDTDYTYQRGKEDKRDTVNVKSGHTIYGFHNNRMLFMCFLLSIKLMKQWGFCVLYHGGFICSVVIYEYPNVPQGEFCKLIRTKRQL